MSALGPEATRRSALAWARDRLGGSATGRDDARFLALDALGLTQADLALHGDRPIGPEAAERLAKAIGRRIAGEPVARIIGEWEFWGLPFRLSPDTLVPRPDTETLVEAVLARSPDRALPLRVLDLGTGSGCILVALLSEYPRAVGLGLDRSLPALATASANARTNGVADRAVFVNGSWCEAVGGPFDVIVANPPYIATAVIAGLDAEVRDHDPLLALDGGADGLDAYRSILDAAARPARNPLAAKGVIHVEIGYDQAGPVTDLARGHGFGDVRLTRDLAGHERVISLAKRPDRAS